MEIEHDPTEKEHEKSSQTTHSPWWIILIVSFSVVFAIVFGLKSLGSSYVSGRFIQSSNAERSEVISLKDLARTVLSDKSTVDIKGGVKPAPKSSLAMKKRNVVRKSRQVLRLPDPVINEQNNSSKSVRSKKKPIPRFKQPVEKMSVSPKKMKVPRQTREPYSSTQMVLKPAEISPADQERFMNEELTKRLAVNEMLSRN
ncbi:MAG: hypothetical protein QF389_07795 [Planctomycetota bacterium]|nr:hypothetical protein [Planctomycetota bacterium]